LIARHTLRAAQTWGRRGPPGQSPDLAAGAPRLGNAEQATMAEFGQP